MTAGVAGRARHGQLAAARIRPRAVLHPLRTPSPSRPCAPHHPRPTPDRCAGGAAVVGVVGAGAVDLLGLRVRLALLRHLPLQHPLRALPPAVGRGLVAAAAAEPTVAARRRDGGLGALQQGLGPHCRGAGGRRGRVGGGADAVPPERAGAGGWRRRGGRRGGSVRRGWGARRGRRAVQPPADAADRADHDAAVVRGQLLLQHVPLQVRPRPSFSPSLPASAHGTPPVQLCCARCAGCNVSTVWCGYMATGRA